MFAGFTQETSDYLWELSFNNERPWFQAHKETFERVLNEPFKALARDTYEELCARLPDEAFAVHISRIYRDARRLFGRGPYKDHMWLVIAKPHEDHLGHPAFYFEIAPNYFSYGCGCWDMTPETTAKLRARIDRDPKKLAAIARKIDKSKFSLYGEEYKRPKGDVGKLLNPWYNRKNIGVSYDDNCEGVLFTPELADEILEGFRFLIPFYEYFDTLPGDPAPEKPL